ncbi:hypothetical protein BGX38DRAFT_1200895, partial [Terfezia claveryi]
MLCGLGWWSWGRGRPRTGILLGLVLLIWGRCALGLRRRWIGRGGCGLSVGRWRIRGGKDAFLWLRRSSCGVLRLWLRLGVYVPQVS